MSYLITLFLGVYLGYRFRDELKNLKKTIWDDRVA